jgi:cytochrome c oxidase cbb3-type subunit I/II
MSSIPSVELQRFTYSDRVVRLFLQATVFWTILTCMTGILAGLLLSVPSLVAGLREDIQPYITFARVNVLQVNMALFGLAGNAVFTGVYYSTQRLCKSQLWSPILGVAHFVGWQLMLVAMLWTLQMGYSQGPLVSGAPWPVDVAIAVLWIVFFGCNIFMTVVNRRERFMYVSLWFYLASIITVGGLLLSSCVAIPMYAWLSIAPFTGVQDALRQSWFHYSLNAYFVTFPLLGFVYYFLPKSVDRPLYSYKLSIVHFWSMVLLFICCGSKQLHFTPIPEWASTLGMLCGIMLWMPCWAGVANGIGTVSGSWQKVRSDITLRFMVFGLFAYGLTSFESALLSFKSVDAFVHYSDWVLAHTHLVEMGWIGFTVFGMIYWLLPRLYPIRGVNSGLAQLHFWLAVLGLVLTVVPEYLAGYIQATKWSKLSDLGRLQFSFMETLQAVSVFWWIRLLGGCIYLAGLFALAANVFFVLRLKPICNESSCQPMVRRSRSIEDWSATPSSLIGKPVLDMASKIDQFAMLDWHRKLEQQPFKFAFLIGFAVCLLSFLQLFPMLAVRDVVPPIASVQPYTPLELAGRDIYISQGCQNCHSQTVRPLVHESQRYGAISQGGEFAFDRPVQWGNRRIGPDLARKGGGVQSSLWHWRHLENPPSMTPETVMPVFKHLHSSKLDVSELGQKIEMLAKLGTPYDLRVAEGSTIASKYKELAEKQAEVVAAEIVSQGGPVAYQGNLIKDTSAIALIAYIQRLGTDLTRPAVVQSATELKPIEPSN